MSMATNAMLVFALFTIIMCSLSCSICSSLCIGMGPKIGNYFGNYFGGYGESLMFYMCKFTTMENYVDISGEGVDCGPAPHCPKYPNGTLCEYHEQCASGWCEDHFGLGLIGNDKECEPRPPDEP